MVHCDFFNDFESKKFMTVNVEQSMNGNNPWINLAEIQQVKLKSKFLSSKVLTETEFDGTSHPYLEDSYLLWLAWLTQSWKNQG